MSEKREGNETKYPFRLFLRVRPSKDGKTELLNCLQPKDATTLKVLVPEDSQNHKKGRVEAEFEYQNIFLPTSTQESVFETTTKPLLDGFLRGKSCLVMAYGVTGSGKTYTVLGPEGNVGLIPRALSHIINGMNSPEFKQTFGDSDDAISLEMSYLEDYQNNIYDLLSPSPRYGQNKTSLMARSDTQGVLHVVGLTEKPVKTIREGMDLIEQGTKEKHMAETKLNLDSSRSHTMCTFNLVRTRTFAKEIIATCRIVDLAGSERASRTEVTGERTAEAGAINTDLLYLMLCLRTMVDPGKANQRMFFRNCKLTHLLSTSIIGSLAGPVHMIINISNERDDFDETFYVLEQTTIVKSIKTVQTKVDNKPPPTRTAGGRRLGAEPESRPMNGADAQRLQRQLVEKERELRKLRSEREEEIRAAIEATELQVRGEMVKEIRERRLNGEKEEDVLDLAGLRASYEAVERQLRSQLASQLAEKDREIEELCQQIQYLETDVSRLQERVELLSNSGGDAETEKLLEKLEEKSEMLTRSDAAFAQQQQELERRLGEMELLLQAKERELVDARNANEAMKNANEAMKRDYETMKKDSELMKKDNEMMKRDNETIKKDYETIKSENKELLDRLAATQDPRVSTTSIKKLSTTGFGTLNARHSPPYGTLDSRFGTLGSHSPRVAPALPTTLPPLRALGQQSPRGSPRGSPRMPPASGLSVPPLRLQPPSRSQSPQTPQTRGPPALPQTAPIRKNLRIDIRSPTTQPSHHFDIPDMALPPSAGASSAFRQ
ncbi:hypothetical protein WA538_002777 [Blastocystis sp. DL]